MASKSQHSAQSVRKSDKNAAEDKKKDGKAAAGSGDGGGKEAESKSHVSAVKEPPLPAKARPAGGGDAPSAPAAAGESTEPRGHRMPDVESTLARRITQQWSPFDETSRRWRTCVCVHIRHSGVLIATVAALELIGIFVLAIWTKTRRSYQGLNIGFMIVQLLLCIGLLFPIMAASRLSRSLACVSMVTMLLNAVLHSSVAVLLAIHTGSGDLNVELLSYTVLDVANDLVAVRGGNEAAAHAMLVRKVKLERALATEAYYVASVLLAFCLVDVLLVNWAMTFWWYLKERQAHRRLTEAARRLTLCKGRGPDAEPAARPYPVQLFDRPFDMDKLQQVARQLTISAPDPPWITDEATFLRPATATGEKRGGAPPAPASRPATGDTVRSPHTRSHTRSSAGGAQKSEAQSKKSKRARGAGGKRSKRDKSEGPASEEHSEQAQAKTEKKAALSKSRSRTNRH